MDEFGHAAGVRFTRADGSEPLLPARAVLVAAGTQPNTVLAREDGRFELDGKYFQAVDASGARSSPVRGLAKPDVAQVLMHRDENGRFVSFFGDLHPSFFGNVVKAMGSAKRGYPVVSRRARPNSRRGRRAMVSGAELIARCRDELVATVHAVNRLTPTIVEVVVRAPAAARAFRPGQFYRLQNYEMLRRAHHRAWRGRPQRYHGAGHGRPGDDRRLDRSGARPGFGDRAGDGRQFRPVRAAEARASRWC